MSQISDQQITTTLLTMDTPQSIPSLKNSQRLPYSPVTSLALNLSDACLLSPSSTPHRNRLSCSNEGTPVIIINSIPDDENIKSTAKRNSLLANSIRLNTGSKFREGVIQPRRVFLSDKWNNHIENIKNKENMVAETISSSKIENTSGKLIVNKHMTSSPRRGYPRQPLEDHDPNSQDSGFEVLGYNQDTNITHAKQKMGFRFAEPIGTAPRRSSESPEAPRKSLFFKTHQSSSVSTGGESVDDGFIELLSPEKEDLDSPGLNYLMSAPLRPFVSPIMEETDTMMSVDNSPAPSLMSVDMSPGNNTNLDTPSSPQSGRSSGQFCIRPPLRRSLALSLTLNANSTTPTSSHVVRNNLFHDKLSFRTQTDSPNNSPSLDFIRSTKRSEPFQYSNPAETEIHPILKRRKSCLNENDSISPCSSTAVTALTKPENKEKKSAPSRPLLHRFFSENDASIDRALQRSSLDPDLIGDFSRPYCLPLMAGRHEDLKSISCETMADLLLGKFNGEIESYSIIDCRYPYEYNGGHIKGAKNIYTRDQLYQEFVSTKDNNMNSTGKRHILIFHCEFSSERGPSLSRFLRNSDRDKNEYPKLYYPELYLLHGGYKDFFEHHSNFCDPHAYLPMLDPRFELDLRHFRSKGKSWSSDSKGRSALRHKRLGR